MIHVILHTLLEGVKLLPFLFLSYLLMEWMEHKMGSKTKKVLAKAGPASPVLGGLLGAVPQCGFSAVASGLYAGRILSLGALVAVFLSTSDEMLPVVFSHSTDGTFALWSVLRILGGKVLIGILVGVIIDLVMKSFGKKEDHHHHGEHSHIGELCEHEGCQCGEKGIWVSSLLHTAKTGAFLLATIFILNTIIHYAGEQAIAYVLSWASRTGFGYFFVALVGLIPNCAASVLITELYLTGGMSVGMLYAGLLTGAGVGTLVLFRTNRNFKKNLLILGILLVVGILFGGLIDLLGLDFMGLKFTA